MQNVVLVAGEHYPIRADALFASFGAHPGDGWLLGASCDELRLGAAVSARIPMGPENPAVQLLGRISELKHGRKVTITHDQPWRGRIHLRFTDEPGGSRLQVVAELDDAGIGWWMEQRGWDTTSTPGPNVRRMGLLTSKTGPGAIFAVACEYLAHLAVDQINADGGIGGKRVELVVHDDATDPGRAALEARRMIASGCEAVIASVTSASFEAVRHAVGALGLPLIHPVLNEGGRGQANIFRWGERPLAQVRAATPLLAGDGAGRSWFHLGNDYSWSHGAHRASVRAIDEAGGSVTQHAFTPLGTLDFSRHIEKIRTSGVTRILSSLVGADEVAFERQLWESGLRERCSVLSLVMDESTRERIGNRAADGIWTAFGYFSALETDTNQELCRRYRDTYGMWAPPISSFSEGVYEAILLYAAAAREPDDVVRALRRVSAEMPRGRVTLNGPRVMRQRMLVGQSSGDGYRIAQR